MCIRDRDCGLEDAAANIRAMLPQVLAAADLDTLRGIEGAAATAYFSVLDHMLLSRKEAFFFHGRSRRPPLDRVNAMLSFAYSLLAHDCASALESVGLDSYVGFLHRDRPGRQSLALDLMEELRPCMADRFVLTLVNNRMLRPEDFQVQDLSLIHILRLGGEKCSYQVPTYEALKGILSSVYWKPTFIWRILDVRVMNPIQTAVKLSLIHI